MNGGGRKRGQRAALIATLAISAVILAATLTYPFNNDNALYAFMGDQLLHGKVPYLGTWDQNFPGIVPIHSLAILLFGRSQLGFHFFDLMLQLCGVSMIYFLVRRFADSLTGALAGILYSLYYVQQGLWLAGQRDAYATLFLLGTLLILTRAPSRNSSLLAGGLIGAACMIRPTYGVWVVGIGAWLMIYHRKLATGFLLGSIIPLLFSLVLYWLLGGLGEFYHATILFNTQVYSGEGSQFPFFEPIRFYLLLVPFFVWGAIDLWKQNREAASLLSLSFLGGMISLLVLYRHSVYHYHPMMTCLVIISARGVYAALKQSSVPYAAPWRRRALVLLLVGFFGIQTFRGNTIKSVLQKIGSGKITTLAESYDAYEGSREFGVNVQQQVADYLAMHTRPGDLVQMFGPYSYPQYAAERSAPTRFQTIHALVMRSGGRLKDFQIEWREEFLRSLRKSPPRYFIVCDAPEAFRQYYGGKLGHEILEQDWSELNAWLIQNYVREAKLGAFTLYRSATQVTPSEL